MSTLRPFSRFCSLVTAVSASALLPIASTQVVAETSPVSVNPEVAEPHVLWNTVNRGSLRAIVQPAQDIRLSARTAGIIERYEAEEGQTLKKDAPILVLDNHEERAQVAQAEAMLRGAQAELDHAEGEFERAKPLSEEKIFSSKQFAEAQYALDLARSRVAQANAALQLAKVRLTDRTIICPFDGLFLKRVKGVGEAVERFEPVARIIDLSFLEIVVYCDASLFGTFQIEQEVSVQVSKSDESQVAIVQGKVSYVDPIIDPANGTFRVRVRLPASPSTAPGYTAVLLPGSKSVAPPDK